MEDLSRSCRLHPRCPACGRRGAGNLPVTGRLGTSRQDRLPYGRSCRARFPARKGAPPYRAHRPEERVGSILEPIAEGWGVLETARLVKVHPDTVGRYTRAAGAPARAAHDAPVARAPEARAIEMDEAGSFVAKQEKSGDEDEPETGPAAIAGVTGRAPWSTAWSSRWSRGCGRPSRSRSGSAT